MATSTTKRSSARKTTSLKAAVGKAPAAQTAAKEPIQAAPQIETKALEQAEIAAADPQAPTPELRKKELLELVVERSGIKKKDAKPVVEAMLAVLGETIASGREWNLQPLGKLRINRSEERSNGTIFICKLRQSAAVRGNASDDGDSASVPLAEDNS